MSWDSNLLDSEHDLGTPVHKLSQAYYLANGVAAGYSSVVPILMILMLESRILHTFSAFGFRFLIRIQDECFLGMGNDSRRASSLLRADTLLKVATINVLLRRRAAFCMASANCIGLRGVQGSFRYYFLPQHVCYY